MRCDPVLIGYLAAYTTLYSCCASKYSPLVIAAVRHAEQCLPASAFRLDARRADDARAAMMSGDISTRYRRAEMTVWQLQSGVTGVQLGFAFAPDSAKMRPVQIPLRGEQPYAENTYRRRHNATLPLFAHCKEATPWGNRVLPPPICRTLVAIYGVIALSYAGGR